MARIFAQHADAGQYQLETRFVANQWKWMATETESKEAKFSGDATTLEDAKKAAAASIGYEHARFAWHDIGPPIELPD